MVSQPSAAPSGPSKSPVLDEVIIGKLERLTPDTICTVVLREAYFTGVPIGVLFPFDFLDRLPDDQRKRINSIPLSYSSQDKSGKIREIHILLNGFTDGQEYVPLSQIQNTR